MITSSAQYQEAIARGTRSTVAQLSFGVFDVTAKGESSPALSSIQPFTNILSIKDDISYPEHNFATFEKDQFLLDGSYLLMPDDIGYTDIIGAWSTILSDEDKVFQVQPVLTIDFSSNHSSLGIGLIFDGLSQVYCTDFNVKWYAGAAILANRDIVDNTHISAYVDEPVQNYNRVVITFIKTNKPQHFLKLLEVNFGYEEIFTSDQIVSGEIIEESDPLSREISINTMKCTLLNENQRFNMLNPEGIYAYLQRKQPLYVQSGLYTSPSTVEYISLGTFYLSDWKNSNGITATLEATDLFGLLDNSIYYNSPFFNNVSVYDAINEVLSDVGTFLIQVDPVLSADTLNGYIPVCSHKEALQYILVAIRAAIRVERDGKITVYRPNYSTPVKVVDYDTMLESPQISQTKFVSQVSVNEFEFSLAASAIEVYKSTFNLNGTQQFTFEFKEQPVDVSTISVSITGNGSMVGTPTSSVVMSKVTILGTGELTVTINAKPYIANTRTVTSELSDLPAGELRQTVSISDNYLISKGAGSLVTQAFLDYYQKRILQRFQYWCDPTLQAGDNISVETMFSDLKTGVIEKQEITFAPELISTMEVVG